MRSVAYWAEGMARTLPVLINRSGGTAAAMGDSLGEQIEAAFAQAGQQIELHVLDGDEIADAVRDCAHAPVVVIGGGDGTISAAASVLARAPAAMAILPLGTRNHLARQLGVPLDLPDAASLAVNGQRRRVDVGAAGERVFVNNASFGIYTRFVRQRDARGGPKWLSTLRATWHVLRHMRAQFFPLRIDGSRRMLESPLLFIGNNRYSMDPGHVGERESLTDGRLSVYAVSARKPHQLIGFAARALLGLANPERDFDACADAREVIIGGEGWIEGALDGELTDLRLPLRLRSLPNALGVVTPREMAKAGAAATSVERTLPDH